VLAAFNNTNLNTIWQKKMSDARTCSNIHKWCINYRILCWLHILKSSSLPLYTTKTETDKSESLLYCSNSCISLHFKTLKSHTKTLKIHPHRFQSPLKPSSGGPRPYFALHRWNELTYGHIPTLFITNVNQHSNLVTSPYFALHRRNELTYGHILTLFITNVNQHSNSVTSPYFALHRRNELTYGHIPTLFITNVNQHSNSVTSPYFALHRWNELTYSHIPTLFITNVNQHSNSVT
jgi:hypothetical protein